MDMLLVVLVMAASFGLCFLLDKGFTKFFRSKAQHQSGKAVRLNKRYATAGLILAVLGISAVFAGIGGQLVLLIGGGVIIAMGVGLIVYYMTFGVYYDDESFLVSSFGRKSRVYHYRDIESQQIFLTSGGTVIELYFVDGGSVSLQATMTGTYDFLDFAAAGWRAQRGKTPEDCPFYDPENSCYFPPTEGE